MTRAFTVRNGLEENTDPGIDCSNDEPITKQEFREESDINHILDHYQTDGLLPLGRGTKEAMYGDFSDPALQNYHEALNIVLSVDQLMGRLPAKVRERFGNDPASLLDFVQDNANRTEALELGLLNPDYKSPSAPPVAEPPTTPPPAQPVTK